MNQIRLAMVAVLVLTVSDAAIAVDPKSYHAMKVCLRFLRNLDARFEALPSEAIVADLDTITESNGIYSVHWTVKWDDPETDAKGTCKVQNNQLISPD